MSFAASDPSEVSRFYLKRTLIKWAPLIVPTGFGLLLLSGLAPVAQLVLTLMAVLFVLVTASFTKLRSIFWRPLLDAWQVWSRNCAIRRAWPGLMDSTSLTIAKKEHKKQRIQRGHQVLMEHRPVTTYFRPRLRRIQRDQYGNRTLTVSTVSTFLIDDWLSATPRLTQAFGVSAIRVTPAKNGHSYLWSLKLIEADGLKRTRRAPGVAPVKKRLAESHEPHHGDAPWWQ